MKWSINRRSTRRVEGGGEALGGEGGEKSDVEWIWSWSRGLVYQMQQSAG